MDIYAIRTDADYQQALDEITTLFDALPDTPEGDRLDVLATLVEAYEGRHMPIPPPDPIDAIVYALESRGLTQRDLEALLGSQARVEEILNRTRPLSLAMIRRLYIGLGIPAHILIQPYQTARAVA